MVWRNLVMGFAHGLGNPVVIPPERRDSKFYSKNLRDQLREIVSSVLKFADTAWLTGNQSVTFSFIDRRGLVELTCKQGRHC